MIAVEVMNWRQRMWKWLASIPRWLWFAAGIVLGAAILALLLGVSRDAAFPAVLALFGVILGGTIAAGTNLIVAQASRRAQIVATTWPRRIEAHQSGFARWWRIMRVVYEKDELGREILEAQDWWAENCLYLSEQAGAEFERMLGMANNHAMLVESYRGTGDETRARIVKENWAEIIRVGQVLAEGADCHLSDRVFEELRSKATINMTAPQTPAGH